MARTGRFGRLPRQAPDLTSTIVSLMEQYEAQRDQNIFDAWQNGGEFEGKKVTDSRLLEFIRMRRNGLERDDPMWDEWNNRLWQYRFTIAEQKAILTYSRGLIGASTRGAGAAAGGLASFYRQWAGKVPRQSAAWRDMMTNAARYQKAAVAAAKAGGSGGGGGGSGSGGMSYETFIRRWNAIEGEYIQAPTVALTGLSDFARSRNLLKPGETLFNLAAYETVTFEDALAEYADTPAGKAISRWMERNLPGYQGELSLDVLVRAANRGRRGAEMQADLARGMKGDYSSYVRSALNKKSEMGRVKQLPKQFDVVGAYLEVTDDWDSARLSAQTPHEALEADATYLKELTSLERKAVRNRDYSLAGKVRMKMSAVTGVVDETRGGNDTFIEDDWAGTSGGGTVTPEGPNEAEMLARNQLKLREDVMAIDAGEKVVIPVATNNDPTDPNADYSMPFLVVDAESGGNYVSGATYQPAVNIPMPDGSTLTVGGKLVPKRAPAFPVMDDQGNVVGWRGELDGEALWHIKDPRPGGDSMSVSGDEWLGEDIGWSFDSSRGQYQLSRKQGATDTFAGRSARLRTVGQEAPRPPGEGASTAENEAYVAEEFATRDARETEAAGLDWMPDDIISIGATRNEGETRAEFYERAKGQWAMESGTGMRDPAEVEAGFRQWLADSEGVTEAVQDKRDREEAAAQGQQAMDSGQLVSFGSNIPGFAEAAEEQPAPVAPAAAQQQPLSTLPWESPDLSEAVRARADLTATGPLAFTSDTVAHLTSTPDGRRLLRNPDIQRQVLEVAAHEEGMTEEKLLRVQQENGLYYQTSGELIDRMGGDPVTNAARAQTAIRLAQREADSPWGRLIAPFAERLQQAQTQLRPSLAPQGLGPEATIGGQRMLLGAPVAQEDEKPQPSLKLADGLYDPLTGRRRQDATTLRKKDEPAAPPKPPKVKRPELPKPPKPPKPERDRNRRNRRDRRQDNPPPPPVPPPAPPPPPPPPAPYRPPTVNRPILL